MSNVMNDHLFGLQHSNPVDTGAAYKGPSSNFGTSHDPLVGSKIGGVNRVSAVVWRCTTLPTYSSALLASAVTLRALTITSPGEPGTS